MSVREILLLGNAQLYEVSRSVRRDELNEIAGIVVDLQDTMRAFQQRHGWGRAIAAPQIGVALRIVCMNVDREVALINPVIDEESDERMEFWEDCMSFPELLVRLENPVSCRLTYRDLDWNEHRVRLTEDYAELIQHEVDHLDGVLSIERALDDRAIALRRALPTKDLGLRGEFREI